MVTFTEEILNGKPYFLYSAQALFKNGNCGNIGMWGSGDNQIIFGAEII